MGDLERWKVGGAGDLGVGEGECGEFLLLSVITSLA